MKLVRTFGVAFGFSVSRRDIRQSADELDVSFTLGAEQRTARAKDVSPTGIFILTQDPLALGGRIPLTLRKWGVRDKSPQNSVRLFAKAVRYDKNGVGLAFDYGNSDPAEWLNLLERASALFEHRDLLGMIRVTAALAYLSRICHANETRSLTLILDELVYENGEKTLDILVDAAEMVSRRGHSTRANVSPEVLNRILLNGAMTSSRWVRNFWAGLLASASLDGADDGKSLEYVSLLSQLDSVQLRIFITACTRSTQFRNESGEIVARNLTCEAEQMRWVAGVSDLVQIERDLDRLSQCGLLEKTLKRDPFALIDVANLTPTPAGLTFYAKCRGLMQPADLSKLQDQNSPYTAEDSADEAARLPSQARLSFA
jgi:hypothetical protein